MVENKETSWYQSVPKNLVDNLRYRAELREWGRKSDENAEQLWLACSRDLLFWINAFVWTYDASGTYGLSSAPKLLPFITYEYQDVAFLEMEKAVSSYDLAFEKSRDMGASWMVLTIFTWYFDFHPMYSFLMVSRKEHLVDRPNDPGSLFWKIDCIHKNLPGFLCPPGVLPGQKNRTKLHVHNESNGSTIDGETTTGNMGKGDRRAAMLLDEFAAFTVTDGYDALAATQAVTKCRIFNSTPMGVGNAFADLCFPPSKTKKLRFHWTDNPWKRNGLYTSTKEGFRYTLKILDTDHVFPPDYPFVLDGKIRSRYYDEECDRTVLASLIAQELDIDFLGSGTQFFSAQELSSIEAQYVRHPYLIGELAFDGKANHGKFTEFPKGRLRLWVRPDADGDLPHDRRYVVGVDVAQGTGASNSVIVVGDKKTGEKVAEFVSPNERPDQLAEHAVAIAGWFMGDDREPAFMIWESNGPGRSFGDRVMELGHGNIFYRQKEDSIAKVSSNFPGWHSTREGKAVLLREYGRAMVTGEFIERSEDTVRECSEFVFLKDGSVAHSKAQSSMDPSGAKDNHGDRVTASAVCWRGMREVSSAPEETGPLTVPGSMAWRMQERKLKLDEERYVFA